MHPTLGRLDELAIALAADPDVAAVLGLGSAGVEHARFDEHSDIDFFVIVDDGTAKRRFLADVRWLAAMGVVGYSFVNDPNGRKALFEDGLFVEYAVFTTEELRAIPFTGARIVWQRATDPIDLTVGGAAPSRTSLDTVDFHLNEALTNLFVGLHRELRGERLAAARFIQVYAVDRVLALARLTEPAMAQHDPFEATRRVETAYPALVGPLRNMVAGYDQNLVSATAVLGWLTDHYDADPVIVSAITALLARLCPDNKEP
jgi:hypothetical protein